MPSLSESNRTPVVRPMMSGGSTVNNSEMEA